MRSSPRETPHTLTVIRPKDDEEERMRGADENTNNKRREERDGTGAGASEGLAPTNDDVMPERARLQIPSETKNTD